MASEVIPWAGGELLYAGGTDYTQLGRTAAKGGKDKDDVAAAARKANFPDLPTPTRLKNLMGVRIMFVAGGSAATHCIAGTAAGQVYIWGRNEKAQLGLGDLHNRNTPVLLPGLPEGAFITGAAAGRHHSLLVARDGASYAMGLNTMGQCGIGAVRSKPGADDLVVTPMRVAIEGATQVAAGIDFSVWLADGKVYACGNPQHGVVGDGDDHSYNAKDSSIQIKYEPMPKPRAVAGPLAGKNMVGIAAGQTHVLAYDDAGALYTWGNGNYGKLGHKVQADEFTPRQVAFFADRWALPAGAQIAAATNASFATSAEGQLFSWGKLKVNGDNQTYPAMMQDLAGWKIRSVACGPGTYAVAADRSVIIWGSATNGELGYGAGGKKSSANPDKCAPLEGWHTQQVACGVGFTLFLVQPDEAKLAALPVYEAAVPLDAGPSVEEATAAGGGKRKATGAAAGGRGKKPATAK